MSGNFISRTKLALTVFATVLAAGLFVHSAYAQKQGSEPSPAPAPQMQPAPSPTEGKKEFKKGTREWTEHCLLIAKKSYDAYQKAICSGTDEEKKLAKQSYEYDSVHAMQAIEDEAESGKEIRHALDELYHYAAIYHRFEENPKTGASELEAAKKDFNKASSKFEELKKKNIKQIRTELGADFVYEWEEQNCPTPSETAPPPEKKKKKKNKGEASGPLDFFGDVTIGVGVGGHSEGHRHKSYDLDRGGQQEETSEKNEKIEHDNISHDSNDRDRDQDSSHEPGGHDDKDKSHDENKHDDHKDSQSAPAPQH